MVVGDVSAALGLANDTLTLSQLIAYAPDLAVEPLEGLLRRMKEAMNEVSKLQESGSRAVLERMDTIGKALNRVEPGIFSRTGYNSTGFLTAPVATASRFDYSA